MFNEEKNVNHFKSYEIVKIWERPNCDIKVYQMETKYASSYFESVFDFSECLKNSKPIYNYTRDIVKTLDNIEPGWRNKDYIKFENFTINDFELVLLDENIPKEYLPIIDEVNYAFEKQYQEEFEYDEKEYVSYLKRRFDWYSNIDKLKISQCVTIEDAKNKMKEELETWVNRNFKEESEDYVLSDLYYSIVLDNLSSKKPLIRYFYNIGFTPARMKIREESIYLIGVARISIDYGDKINY